MDAPTDETLLQEFVAGKRASFELLVRRHTQELYRFAYRVTGSSAAAEDVVQESFLQVFVSARGFDPARRFRPWLFTIAGNKARDFLRKLDRRKEVPVDALIDEDEADTGRRFVDLLAGPEVASDDLLGLDERRRVVREVLAGLPVHLNEILVLAYYHHFSYRDIAAIVGVPIGTVKSRLHWAVVAFGQRYRDEVAGRSKKQGT